MNHVLQGRTESELLWFRRRGFGAAQDSRLTVERGVTLFAVSILRLVTGAVASVWGRGPQRRIITPTLTAGFAGPAPTNSWRA